MYIKILSENDVICGGSRKAKCHPGNQRYENIINQYISEYKNASKKQRSEILYHIQEFYILFHTRCHYFLPVFEIIKYS